MGVSSVMTRDPVTVDPNTTVAEVWDLMRELEIRHVPVVDGGVLVGMVSDRDLAHFDIGRALVSDGAEALRLELGTPVVKIMSFDVVSITPDTAITEVIDLLVEHKVGAVPVVRSGLRHAAQPARSYIVGVRAEALTVAAPSACWRRRSRPAATASSRES